MDGGQRKGAFSTDDCPQKRYLSLGNGDRIYYIDEGGIEVTYLSSTHKHVNRLGLLPQYLMPTS